MEIISGVQLVEKIDLKYRTRKTSPLGIFICFKCKNRFISYIKDVQCNKIRMCFNCRKLQKDTGKTIIYHKINDARSHGYAHHPLCHVWHAMKYRCFVKTDKQYENYGGRGISVCKAWRFDFLEFFYWAINNGWEDNLQIDRKDNDGDYTPENCRFVLRKINCRNTRIPKNNKTGFIGVSQNKETNKWLSMIFIDRIHIFIGSFNTKIQAVSARDEFIIEYKLEGFNLQFLTEKV